MSGKSNSEPGAIVQLKPLNSFGLNATSAGLQVLAQPGALSEISFDPQRDLILGGGSNVLLAGNIDGQVLQVGFRDRSSHVLNSGSVRVRLGAGENWHEAVRWTIEQGLCGLENLSLIPGLCGAAPIQNIGAYGVELASLTHGIEAWDWKKRELRRFDREDCAFGYRDSRFKSGEPDRYLITALELDLQTARYFEPRLDYAGLREELEAMSISRPGPRDVSDAVVRLRKRKLPDPAKLGNAGSFFKNPVLAESAASRLRKAHPNLPLYPDGDGRWKASAGWLIEASGWKGFREGDAGVAPQHALVLVNYGEAQGHELVELALRIRNSVQEKFSITLENEPRIIGNGLRGDLPALQSSARSS